MIVNFWRRSLTHAMSKVVATCRKTEPVWPFRVSVSVDPSAERTSCSVMLNLRRHPNCSWRSGLPSFTCLRTVAGRMFSKKLPTVLSWLMGQKDLRQRGLWPGFIMDSTRECLYGDGKYCLWGTALNAQVRKIMAHLGRCLYTLFGVPFGLGTLSSLSPFVRVWYLRSTC
jgi:hypothetical protein